MMIINLILAGLGGIIVGLLYSLHEQIEKLEEIASRLESKINLLKLPLPKK